LQYIRSLSLLSSAYTSPPHPPTLSLPAALPIYVRRHGAGPHRRAPLPQERDGGRGEAAPARGRLARDPARLHRARHRVLVEEGQDRKSTRLNSSHLVISYAVFCL